MKRNPIRVAIPTSMGFDYIPVEGIVYCRASGNYTQLVFKEGQLLITRSLKEMEKHLLTFNFIRIHHSYLINLDHLERYFRGGGGAVEMSNGEKLPVAKSKKLAFMGEVFGERTVIR